jgi:hypothetical protein
MLSLALRSPAAPSLGIVGWVVVAYHAAVAAIEASLRAVSQHTGIPIVVVAATALVLSYHFARRAARLAVQIGIVVAVLFAATKLGWIHW